MSASCNLLRLRTCVDTIAHLTDVVKNVTAISTVNDGDNSSRSQSTVEPSSDMPSVDSVNDDDIVPDLADAMAELDAGRKTSDPGQVKLTPEGKSLLKKVSKKSGGQVFFFPDESQKLSMESSFPPGLGMSESFYQGRNDHDDLQVSDDSIDLDEFCVLEAIGTGFSKNGEAAVKLLDGDDPVVFVENHFPVPEKSIDYLKTPKGFPDYQARITLKRISLLWQIFGGKDLTTSTSFTVLGSGAADRSIVLSTLVGKGGLAETLKTRGGPHRIESQLIEVVKYLTFQFISLEMQNLLFTMYQHLVVHFKLSRI